MGTNLHQKGPESAAEEDEVPGIFRVEVGVALDRMKFMVERALFDHAAELRRQAGAHIQRMIESGVVDRLIQGVIEQTAREVIESSVKGAITSAFYDTEFREDLRKGLIKQMRAGR